MVGAHAATLASIPGSEQRPPEDVASCESVQRGLRSGVSGAVAMPVTDRVAAFVNLGRTLTPIEEGGTKLALSGGISIRFSALTSTP